MRTFQNLFIDLIMFVCYVMFTYNLLSGFKMYSK